MMIQDWSNKLLNQGAIQPNYPQKLMKKRWSKETKNTGLSEAEMLREEVTCCCCCCCCWAWSPSRRFLSKLSSLLFFRISTRLSSLLLLPSSASTATLYLFLLTSTLAFGLNDMAFGLYCTVTWVFVQWGKGRREISKERDLEGILRFLFE